MFKSWDDIRRAIDDVGEYLDIKISSNFLKRKIKSKKIKKKSRKQNKNC